jgi:hypothetical protein
MILGKSDMECDPVLRLLLPISLAWISLSLLGTLLWMVRVELVRLARRRRRFGGPSPMLRPLIHTNRSFGR